MVAAALAAVAACTVDPDSVAPTARCREASKCPADPPPTADEIDTCEHALASRCAQLYQELLTCVRDHQTCGPAGRSDPEAVRAACESPATAYAECVPSPPDAAPYPEAGLRD
jgi:hypothetical protein